MHENIYFVSSYLLFSWKVFFQNINRLQSVKLYTYFRVQYHTPCCSRLISGDPMYQTDVAAHTPVQFTRQEAPCLKRTCVICRAGRVKTKSGGSVETRWKCLQCNVPLCRGIRDCFNIFHSAARHSLPPFEFFQTKTWPLYLCSVHLCSAQWYCKHDPYTG